MVAVISPPLGLQNSGGRESMPVTLVSPAATDGVVTDDFFIVIWFNGTSAHMGHFSA